MSMFLLLRIYKYAEYITITLSLKCKDNEKNVNNAMFANTLSYLNKTWNQKIIKDLRLTLTVFLFCCWLIHLKKTVGVKMICNMSIDYHHFNLMLVNYNSWKWIHISTLNSRKCISVANDNQFLINIPYFIFCQVKTCANLWKGNSRRKNQVIKYKALNHQCFFVYLWLAT